MSKPSETVVNEKLGRCIDTILKRMTYGTAGGLALAAVSVALRRPTLAAGCFGTGFGVGLGLGYSECSQILGDEGYLQGKKVVGWISKQELEQLQKK
eukprot:CAMPEP_0177660216 /NCGR_PEP_ID=MMETSP0447-20121125/17903_1 /TAXON_ID=0 /ORGANISM="Stygamoeba regulata, Strain BSH-02190019" /LENGTH=96 /DNA_ID=CAMNT_0019165229 /DNA_START=30 /DNA_END=320 /DNA_ORIENTATION=+